ncbi:MULTISPECIES: hypothetical protein [Pseudoalteromonas]|jgi:hypothetical protein|uniref:SdiA-regulated n=2 Tax=Pseudoalteromonas agarivorans TaxID=176102 RepID=A0AAD0U2L6_9GAMM|nr:MULTISPECIES: hypothetical protein [Pseudoalteromonas]MAJ39048.1 hypothetical protein [Pseudoalteromonadaceae bacterium]OUX91985.1 MAG: hypothetical protein CBC03_02980 [Pseudoalteromonas sp. TMED43]ATC84652.1 hypothetical protein PAGA_b0802 [Pseudoalteromonas agarivorans DSM 14585]AYM88670.1 hypothetical protein D9T18_18480 [Pseudoalteromonas agarivorans]MDC9499008.1 hypothetical protein [Pseudoalteromonas sp. Angola-20]|tara:strand:- start:7531 stop:8463 length:933 start_codon:yes stop_codon:yes gene_type:complete
MLKKSILFTTVIVFIALASFVSLSVYTLYSKKQLSVDPKLKEISGIEFDKKKRLWAINDGGDDPKLYRLGEDGAIEKEILVTNAKNIDWEDMTQNKFGHFFLGDFGNNKNDRKWLTIYKIENPIDIKTETTEAEIIKFTYPEMDGTPITPNKRNFDLEAFVEYKRHLYLFTKNRTEPFDGITNVYKVGDHAANFDAQLIDSFKTCTTLEKLCWITSAALSPDRTKLVLLDSTSIWLFENFKGDKFFSGDVSRIDLGIVTQKEAITFYDDNTLIFTDEEFKGLVGGNAYVIKLNEAQKTVIRQAPKTAVNK